MYSVKVYFSFLKSRWAARVAVRAALLYPILAPQQLCLGPCHRLDILAHGVLLAGALALLPRVPLGLALEV